MNLLVDTGVFSASLSRRRRPELESLVAPEAFGYASMAGSGFDVVHCFEARCSPGEWMMLMVQTGAGGAAGLFGLRGGALVTLLLGQLKLGPGSADFDFASARSCSSSAVG